MTNRNLSPQFKQPLYQLMKGLSEIIKQKRNNQPLKINIVQ